MKNVMTAAIAATLLAAPALADGHSAMVGANSGLLSEEIRPNMIHAENVIGAEIFALDVYEETEWNETDFYTEADSNWAEVGNVTDVVFSRDGKMVGVVASMGGWLDIGDTDMLIHLDDIRFVGERDAEGWGNLDIVTRLSEERIEAIEEMDSTWY